MINLTEKIQVRIMDQEKYGISENKYYTVIGTQTIKGKTKDNVDLFLIVNEKNKIASVYTSVCKVKIINFVSSENVEDGERMEF